MCMESECFSTVHSLTYAFSSIAGRWIIFALTDWHSFLRIDKDLLLFAGPCNAAFLVIFVFLPYLDVSLLSKLYMKVFSYFPFAHFLLPVPTFHWTTVHCMCLSSLCGSALEFRVSFYRHLNYHCYQAKGVSEALAQIFLGATWLEGWILGVVGRSWMWYDLGDWKVVFFGVMPENQILQRRNYMYWHNWNLFWIFSAISGSRVSLCRERSARVASSEECISAAWLADTGASSKHWQNLVGC